MSSEQAVKVWDPLVRVVHWTLAVAFFVAYFTGDDQETLHVWAGYLILGVVVFRVIWGFVGTRHARFGDFVTGPGTALRYLKDEIGGCARRFLGHNPAGGAMIVLLLLGVLLTSITGLAVYGAEGEGPLAGWMAVGHDVEEVLEEVHEVLANVTLFLVGLHVAGVLLGSVRHRENLVASMVHGYKRKKDA